MEVRNLEGGLRGKKRLKGGEKEARERREKL